MKWYKGKTIQQLLFYITFVCLFTMALPVDTDAFSDQVVQKGATGEDVVELQARLQYNGYYEGDIDGVFGWGTYWSVRNFQEKFELEVDGLVGQKMKGMLEKATEFDKEFVHRMLREGREFTYYGGVDKNIQKGPKGGKDKEDPKPKKDTQETKQPAKEKAPDQAAPEPPAEAETPEEGTPKRYPGEDIPDETPAPEEAVPQEDDGVSIQKAVNVPEGYSDNDINIMAQAVHGEARGEPHVGKVAVAAVILNRVQSPTFPNTVTDVIFEPRAFTAVADGQIWLTPNEDAKKAVLDAINGQDPTGNALYYFNPDTATSAWIWGRPQIKQIGKHVFCE
ncbi:spore cortex-lytic enzyme [Salipaludibacillus neizhouensis]|uniref:Spore cortex-lytic enzyme n=1 Tax=Salipaludibacillus neizhouensis TaxID=885475 RepID=A0A3A9K3C8_9BACI|nr:spore cortex-lytic enzyme [Salipaludibacillus neizhouensis]